MQYRILFCAGLCCGSMYGQETRTHVMDSLQIIIMKQNEAKRMETVSEKTIKEKAGENLAELLKSEAGMSVRKAGATISKPVIDGQTNTRILLLTRGQKLETQDWADSHAPEIDPFGTPAVTIIKGSEGVRYGAGAMGGVILLEPKAMNFKDKFGGEVQLSGASNSGKSVGNLMLEGSILKNSLAWRVQSSGKYAGDYRTAEYYVNNTGIRELNFSGDLQYRKGKYSSKLSFSRYQAKSGIFYGSLSGNTEQFQQMLELGVPVKVLPFSYNITAPYQQSVHLLARTQQRYAFSPKNVLELNYGYQKNHRKEFEVRRMDRTVLPSQNSELQSHVAEVFWENKQISRLKLLSGAGFQRKENINIPGTGVVPAIPNYVLYNYHGFLTADYFYRKWTVDLGARYDFRTTNAAGYNFLGELYGGKKHYKSLSWNAGMRYDFNKNWSASANAGLAWRSPEPYELYVNGKQHGIPIYFVGDTSLKPEKGLKINGQIKWSGENANVAVSGFYQPIQDYIYSIPSHQFKQLFSGPAAIFNFEQTDALYYGGDISAGVKLGNLQYHGNASFVFAEEYKSHRVLPQIPPFGFNQSVNWSIPTRLFQEFYLKLEHEFRAKQSRFNPAYDLAPDSPPAYHLFTFLAGAEWPYQNGKTISIQLIAENFTNKLYKNYTDLYRYFTHEKGIDIMFKTAITF